MIESIAGKHKPPRLFSGRIRDWKKINGITLHQTGCRMPTDFEKWHKLNAHYGVTSGGVAVCVNDPTMMIWHAQKLSHRTIGIEIAGNYPGIQGVEKTLWKGGGPAHELTEEMIRATMEIITDIANKFVDLGKKKLYIYGHRQSSLTRRADPGSEIWQQIALRAEKEIEICETRGAFHTKKGRTIPNAWDDRIKGRY